MQRPETLTSLQALRGVAALSVVLFHLLNFETTYLPGIPIIPGAFNVGRAGVDVFFVLSGFFFTWTTAHSQGGGTEALRFLRRRLTRIYPTYWVYCALLLLMHGLEPLRFQANTDIPASLLLFPTARPTLLLVSWTLVFEVYFYLTFATVLLLGRTIQQRLALLFAWGTIIAAARWLLAPSRAEVTLDLVLSPLAMEFLAGCVSAFLADLAIQGGVCQRVWWAALSGGALATVLAFAGTDPLYSHPWWRVAAFGTGVAVLLFGCVGTETALRRILPRFMVLLGDASYSLYLSHLLTIAVAGILWSRLIGGTSALNHAAALSFAVAASVVVSVWAHRLVEKPLLRGIRHLGGYRRMVTA